MTRSPPRIIPVQLLLQISVLSLSACGSENLPQESLPGMSPEPTEGIFATLELEDGYPEGFSFLNGVRELSDGTVLVADPLAQLLLRIDFIRSAADTLGRIGPGPQEYEQPDQVFPLPGDSTLLLDLGKARLTVVHPDGTFGGGLSMMLPSEDSFPYILHPRFVDENGDLYHQSARFRDGGPPDSAAITRFHRDSAVLDTVATVWLPENPPRATRGFGYLPRMLEPRDDWAVGPDGRIAVIRAADFSVEWRYPDGQTLVGPSYQFQKEAVSRADQEVTLSELRSSAITTTSVFSRSGGVERMSMSRGIANAGDGPGIDDFEWSEELPPFRPDRAVISPEGEVWVERWMPAGSDSRWEVFDGRGQWLGSVEFPPRHRIIGFGHSPDGGEVAYVVRADDLDLKWLERYRVVR